MISSSTSQEMAALIRYQILAMEDKLNETVSGMERGPVRDAARIMVPMMKDQLQIQRDIISLIMNGTEEST